MSKILQAIPFKTDEQRQHFQQTITKTNTGMLVLSGTANLFTGGLTQQAGTTKVMPLGGTNLVNPLSSSAALTFNTLTVQSLATGSQNYFVLDNSKTSGTLTQTLGNLSTGTAGGISTIALNNGSGNALSLIFSGTSQRLAC